MTTSVGETRPILKPVVETPKKTQSVDWKKVAIITAIALVAIVSVGLIAASIVATSGGSLAVFGIAAAFLGSQVGLGLGIGGVTLAALAALGMTCYPKTHSTSRIDDIASSPKAQRPVINPLHTVQPQRTSATTAQGGAGFEAPHAVRLHRAPAPIALGGAGVVTPSNLELLQNYMRDSTLDQKALNRILRPYRLQVNLVGDERTAVVRQFEIIETAAGRRKHLLDEAPDISKSWLKAIAKAHSDALIAQLELECTRSGFDQTRLNAILDPYGYEMEFRAPAAKAVRFSELFEVDYLELTQAEREAAELEEFPLGALIQEETLRLDPVHRQDNQYVKLAQRDSEFLSHLETQGLRGAQLAKDARDFSAMTAHPTAFDEAAFRAEAAPFASRLTRAMPLRAEGPLVAKIMPKIQDEGLFKTRAGMPRTIETAIRSPILSSLAVRQIMGQLRTSAPEE